MNNEMTMKALEIEYAAIVEEQNRRARRIARATGDERKKWEARYNKTMERRHGFETALKAIGYRVIRTYKDTSFYSEITDFKFIESL